ncbi:glycosyltransferase family 2 protein [Enterovibrio baiacu]|uniref:glycosyltransferase family 2 protein n=1 Tax=Enterovibrio baiacu TaxID=2491023 RepID=UPI003D09CD02
MHPPLFTIIIPCYNSASYVNKAIESVKSQTNNAEIIVVDDGSTDNLFEVLPIDIIYIKKENGGVSSARNLGIEKAKGQYLIFLDSDDEYQNGLFEHLKTIISNHKSEFISWGFDIHKNNNIIRKVNDNLHGEMNGKEYLKMVLTKSIYQSVCTVCIKSEIVKKHLRFSEQHNYAEDTNFLIETLLHVKSVYYINKSYFNYIMRDDSAMSVKYDLSRLTVFDLYEKTRVKINDTSVLPYFDSFVCMCLTHIIILRIKDGSFKGDLADGLVSKIYLYKRMKLVKLNKKISIALIFKILSSAISTIHK